MIVVTGAAGFIGSNLVRALNAQGEHDIVAVDSLYGEEQHRNLNSLVIADYLDKDELLAALPGLGTIDAIFHHGACASTTEHDARFMLETNFTYSKRLAEHAIPAGIPLIYASSAAVYGAGRKGFRETPGCEDPLNVYGFSKLAFDNWIRRRIDTATGTVVGLRYFNVYGPQENHKGEMQSVARRFYAQHRAGGPLRLFEGSERFARDFVFVDDCTTACLHFFRHGGRGVFNLGSGRARTFAELASVAIDLLGPCEIEDIPFPAGLRQHYQTFTEADLTALRGSGFEHAFTSLEDGLRRYYALLDDNDGFFRPDKTR